MGSNSSATSFKTLIGKVFKTESSGVVAGSLLSVSNPEDDVIKTKELSDFRLLE